MTGVLALAEHQHPWYSLRRTNKSLSLTHKYFSWVWKYLKTQIYFIFPKPGFSMTRSNTLQHKQRAHSIQTCRLISIGAHCRDRAVLRPSYIHSGISITGKTYLYWVRTQSFICLSSASVSLTSTLSRNQWGLLPPLSCQISRDFTVPSAQGSQTLKTEAVPLRKFWNPKRRYTV